MRTVLVAMAVVATVNLMIHGEAKATSTKIKIEKNFLCARNLKTVKIEYWYKGVKKISASKVLKLFEGELKKETVTNRQALLNVVKRRLQACTHLQSVATPQPKATSTKEVLPIREPVGMNSPRPFATSTHGHLTRPESTSTPTSIPIRTPPATITPTRTVSPTATPTLTPTIERCAPYKFYNNVHTYGEGPATGASINYPPRSRFLNNKVYLVHSIYMGSWPSITASAQIAGDAAYRNHSVELIDGWYYINGGIPQHISGVTARNANLQRHLTMSIDQLIAATPPDWDGVVAIDFEDWPLAYNYLQPTAYHAPTNSNRPNPYIASSLQYTLSLFPDLGGQALINKSRELYQDAGIHFLRETILAYKTARPNAKVGVYDLILRNYYGINDTTRALNDIALPVNEVSDLMIADNYIPYPSYNNAEPLLPPSNNIWEAPPIANTQYYKMNERYVKENIDEARRLAVNAGGKQVLAYSWFRYASDDTRLLNSADLFLQLLKPKILGADAVALWGFERLESLNNSSLQNYYDSSIFPMIDDYCRNKPDGPFQSLFERIVP